MHSEFPFQGFLRLSNCLYRQNPLYNTVSGATDIRYLMIYYNLEALLRYT